MGGGGRGGRKEQDREAFKMKKYKRNNYVVQEKVGRGLNCTDGFFCIIGLRIRIRKYKSILQVWGSVMPIICDYNPVSLFRIFTLVYDNFQVLYF